MFKHPFPFENHMSRRCVIAGLVYFPFHAFILPVFLPQLLMSLGIEDEATMNLIYYGIGIFLVLTAFFAYLREQFDVLLDRLGHCIISFFMALGLDYILSYAVSLLMLGLTGADESAGGAAIESVVVQSGGMIRAVGIFMVPIVEEILFRGVIFGSVRAKNRLAAYIITVIMFAVCHVWQLASALEALDMLLLALQYVPLGIILCWLYERSGTIWMPIGFHMMINAMSFAVEKMLAQMS